MRVSYKSLPSAPGTMYKYILGLPCVLLFCCCTVLEVVRENERKVAAGAEREIEKGDETAIEKEMATERGTEKEIEIGTEIEIEIGGDHVLDLERDPGEGGAVAEAG